MPKIAKKYLFCLISWAFYGILGSGFYERVPRNRKKLLIIIMREKKKRLTVRGEQQWEKRTIKI